MTDKSNKNQQVKSSGVFKSAMAMSTGTLASRVLGFVRDALLAAFFSKTVTDAFIAAFRLPNMFRRLFGEGALAVSFIPIYVEQIPQQSQADRLSSSFFTLLSLITATISVLGVLFMDQLIPLVLSGDAYEMIQGKLELTVLFARIMFTYLFLVTSFAFFSAVAQSHKYFLIPALGPALFNAVFIIFCFFPTTWFNTAGENLAWGVLAGGLIQAGLVFILLFKIGRAPTISFDWKVKGLFKVIRNTLPGIVGMGIVQFMSIINLTYLSRLEEGAISYFFFADRILELPQSLIAISLGSALLPKLSELWSSGKKEELLKTSSHHLKLLLFLALPSAVGIFVLSQPIIETLFVRGEFTVADAAVTASVVQVYALLLIASSLNKVLVPNIYALKNTWLPATITAVCLFIHILIAPRLMEEFGLIGLAYSMTFAAILNTISVFVSVQLLIGSLRILEILKSVIVLLPGLILMGATVGLLNNYLFSFKTLGHQELARPLILLICVLIGAVTYFVYCSMTKNPLMREVLNVLKRKRS